MKILVTGSRGFIATRLVQALQAQGHDVDGFDVLNGQDLRNYEQVRDAVNGNDAVFHLAAVADLNYMRVHPRESLAINVHGTENVALACRDSGAILYFASTCCVYGNQPVHPVTEKTLPLPAELYAASKLASEDLIVGLSMTHGLRYNLMRFATIYGPGTRPALASHIFMGQALRGEDITVHGTGEQTRTLTYIDDLVDGIVALFNSGKQNDVWNLSAESEVSALRMATEIRYLTRSDSRIVFVPDRPGQTLRESISADKMLKATGWHARTDWGTGVRAMLEWFLSTNQVENRYRIPEAIKEEVPQKV